MTRRMAIAIGAAGTLVFLAVLHAVAVASPPGSRLAAAFAGTCAWCH